MPLCVSIEFLCLSAYQSVCLSKSLYMPVCLHVSLSLSLSLSICGVDLADPGSQARYRAIQAFNWDSKSVPFPINFSWYNVEAHYPNYVHARIQKVLSERV